MLVKIKKKLQKKCQNKKTLNLIGDLVWIIKSTWGKKIWCLKKPKVTSLENYTEELLWNEYYDQGMGQLYEGPNQCYWDRLYIVYRDSKKLSVTDCQNYSSQKSLKGLLEDGYGKDEVLFAFYGNEFATYNWRGYQEINFLVKGIILLDAGKMENESFLEDEELLEMFS